MDRESILIKVYEYLELISNNFKTKKAYLFGSFAKGEQKKDSDIDIAIILEDIPDFFKIQMELMQLRRNIDLRIEPHPIAESDFNKSNPLAAEIIKTGIELNLKPLF